MNLTHDDLTNLGTQLGYDDISNGLCAGFAGMWMQAVLADDEKAFYERLDFIAANKNNFPELVKKIKNKNILQADRTLRDILAFFDGIKLYTKPRCHRDFFPYNAYINQADISSIFYLTRPNQLDKCIPQIVLDKEYCFSKNTLTYFLNDLAIELAQTNVALPILLMSGDHTVSLKYDKHDACWHYSDINNLGNSNSLNTYYMALNTQALVDNIFSSFDTDTYAVFNTQIVSTEINDSLKKSLEKIDQRYFINEDMVNKRDNDNYSLLYLSCRHGSIENVKQLLKYPQLDVNQAAALATPLFIACQLGYTEIVKELLKAEKIDINKAVPNGATPLYIACQNGHIEIVKEFLKHEKVNVNLPFYGKMPISIAHAKGHTEIVIELLKYYSATFNQTQVEGKTPFYLACQEGDITTYNMLLESDQLDINQASVTGATPLYIACQNGHTEIVTDLLTNDEIETNKAGANGATPLFIACQNGRTEIVKALLRSEKVDIDKALANGATPFYIACQMGHTEIVKEFLKYKNVDINMICFSGSTPLNIARDRGHAEIVLELLNYEKMKGIQGAINDVSRTIYNFFFNNVASISDNTRSSLLKPSTN